MAGGLLSRMYRGESDFQIVPKKRIWLSIAAGTVLASVLCVLIFGLNLSIDFQGGTAWTFSYQKGAGAGESTDTAAPAAGATGERPAESAVRAAVQAEGVNPEKILFLGNDQVQVEAQAVDAATARRVEVALAELVGVSAEDAPLLVSVNTVSGTWGGEISRKAIRALVVFLIVVSFYISLRFEWQMALAAIVAMAHDVVLTAGVYSLTGFSVSPATVIATLTILGYSLYDSVIVFDKVKEVSGTAEGVATEYDTMVNRALNQVLMRSINTSVTSLLPVSALLIAGLFFGAETLKDFALALFVGLLAGVYSSIFIASPLVGLLGRPKGTRAPSPARARSDAIKKRREASAEHRSRERRRSERPTSEALARLAAEDEDSDVAAPVAASEVGIEDEDDVRPVRKRSADATIPSGGRKQGSKPKSKGGKGRPKGARPTGKKKKKKRR